LLSCGAAATTCGQLVAYPLQLIRTRLQAQGMKGRPVVYTGILDCAAQTIRCDGISGLYRGILPNFMKSLPAISISYAVYETAKASLSAL
jgi:solute carrier family 25 phosphate transporter 23/24/25/41